MTTWVALFRGINVGGRNVIPMRTLVDVFDSIGAEDVQTYIQSGNVVFRHAESRRPSLEAAIRAGVGRSAGFEPDVMLVTTEHLEKIASDNPFPVDPPNALHVFFLKALPGQPDLESLSTIASGNEQFELVDQAFFLYAPDGMARSKVAARAERCLGTSTTARNWRTVSRLCEMVASLP